MVGRLEVGWDGVNLSAVALCGVEWSGVKLSGVEWSGVLRE